MTRQRENDKFSRTLPFECSWRRSLRFSERPTTSTADTRMENLAPVLSKQIKYNIQKLFIVMVDEQNLREKEMTKRQNY